MENNSKKQAGMVEVEATFIFPIMIVCVLLILYLSLILYQRANLQATLETALLYYKNTMTDTFVMRNEEIEYGMKEGAYLGYANSYSAEEALNPYRWVDGENKSAEGFDTYFTSVAQNMLFDDKISMSFDFTNYFLLKEIKVDVSQEITIPFSLKLLGLDNTYMISTSARMVAVDHEDTIRNVDYVIDIVEDTKVGEFFADIGNKVAEWYGEFKKVLKM